MKKFLVIFALLCVAYSTADIFLGEAHYPGFIQISETDDMFYWYFQSRNDKVNDPLVIWLTGGPGCSSELAIFYENGPFTINEDLSLKVNPYSWNNGSNLLYVDQPIGTGFSKGDPSHYVKNETEVANDFYIFITKFIEKFPELKGRPLFVTGESYAGHYIPAISAKLHREKNPDIVLIGSAIGNGWVNPKLQYLQYAQYAYENKLISQSRYYLLSLSFKYCAHLIEKGPQYYNQAMEVCSGGVDAILGNPQKFNTYDIRIPCQVPGLCYNFSLVESFLKRDDVITALGVQGRKWEDCNMNVHSALTDDWMCTLSDDVKYLLENGVRVLVYSGDKDFICNWRGGESWTFELDWAHQKEFQTAKYQDWVIDNKSYGEFRTSNFFTFLRVYEAGHMVPLDQPKAAYDMLERFFKKWAQDYTETKIEIF